jgi:hypothetical protein
LIPALAYWRVTRSPLYHTSQNKVGLGKLASAFATGAIAHGLAHASDRTDYYYENSGVFHHSDHTAGCTNLIFVVIIAAFCIWLTPFLTLFNFARNYVIHWYT